MLMRYDEVKTSGTPQVEVFLCVYLWDVFLVTHVVELTHLRLLHSQMSHVERN